MGQLDALSTADFVPSIVDQNLTATEVGATVDCTDSRGEGFIVELITENAAGDVTVELQERDPGGSFSAIADSDLDFSGAPNASSNTFTLSSAGATKEAIRYKGDAADLRVEVTSVASTPDYETAMGVVKTMPRNGLFN